MTNPPLTSFNSNIIVNATTNVNSFQTMFYFKNRIITVVLVLSCTAFLIDRCIVDSTMNDIITNKIKLLSCKQNCIFIDDKRKNKTSSSYNTSFNVQSFLIKDNRNISIPHIQEMKDYKLYQSLKHQRKFFLVKDQVLSWVKNHPQHHNLLYSHKVMKKSYAYNLNKKYAFLHIFKNGGTTIGKQRKIEGHDSPKKVGNRHLLATIRDPIDHFLSGWAECGSRHSELIQNNSYDIRVRDWLTSIKNCLRRSHCSYQVHSFPQSNFLLVHEISTIVDVKFNPKMDIVGDLRELPVLLKLVGFTYDTSISTGRNATKDIIKVKYFPKATHLLSNNTLKDLCTFLALDYYLFDFEPPPVCYDEIISNMRNILDMTL